MALLELNWNHDKICSVFYDNNEEGHMLVGSYDISRRKNFYSSCPEASCSNHYLNSKYSQLEVILEKLAIFYPSRSLFGSP